MWTEHLLFTLGLVTTGADPQVDCIVEIAAVVIIPRCLEDETFETDLTFQAFIKPDKEVKNVVRSIEGINIDDLQKEDAFSVVLPAFLEWMQEVIKEAKRKTSAFLLTALVSHYGFRHDFRFLLNQAESNFPASAVDKFGFWCQFADSWEYVTRLKAAEILDKDMKTGLFNLVSELSSEKITGRRALPRAKAVRLIILSPKLREHLLEHLDLLTYRAYKVIQESSHSWRPHFEQLVRHFGLDLIYIETLEAFARNQLTFRDIRSVFLKSRNYINFRIKFNTRYPMELSDKEAHEVYKACKSVLPYKRHLRWFPIFCIPCIGEREDVDKTIAPHS